jgi:3'(2'), 5'-bisphosphate nucleotidase
MNNIIGKNNNLNPDLKSFLSIALAAAEHASMEILKIYQQDDFQTKHKEDNSPVTLADRLAHEAIVEQLRKTEIPVLSEEGKNISYEERRNWELFWMVDPLDGTKEFLKRNGEFTVNIALLKNNIPVLGVVVVPVSGVAYYAIEGQGAFYKSNGTTIKLKERQTPDLNRPGLRVVASRSHMNEETALFIKELKEPELIAVGSSLKFIAVAKGEADVYPRYIPCMEWDTAAADVIIREVGLKIINVENQEPLTYNKESLKNPFFICA